MHTRPTHRPAQTLKQAKAEFAKHGPRVSSQEARQLERGAELFRRAEKLRDAERRRKLAARKKQDKEDREREARRRMGIASQKPYVSPHQPSLGAFFATGKRVTGKNEEARQSKLKLKGEAGASQDEMDTVETKSSEDPWEQEDLDDKALLLADHDKRFDHAPTSNHSSPFKPDEATLVPLSAVKNDFILASTLHHKRTSSSPSSPTSPLPLIQSPTSPPHSHNQSPPPPETWHDFLASSTQIARELCSSPPPLPPRANPPTAPPAPRHDLPPLSTQDITFSPDDLLELGLAQPQTPVNNHCPLRPPPPLQSHDRDRQTHDRALMPPPSRSLSATIATTTTTTTKPAPLRPPSNNPMPPPARPLKRMPFKPPSPLRLAAVAASAVVVIPAFDPQDFVLSTQDRREISG